VSVFARDCNAFRTRKWNLGERMFHLCLLEEGRKRRTTMFLRVIRPSFSRRSLILGDHSSREACKVRESPFSPFH
jgi:hypothetical protein